MILAMIEHYSNGNKAQFASRLGITPQGLSTWIKRESFDLELVFSKCEGLSAQWLLTGDGDMLKPNVSQEATPVSKTANECSTACDKDTQNSLYTQENPDFSLAHKQLLDALLEKTEEIGRLKARIDELERRRGDSASDAPAVIARAV